MVLFKGDWSQGYGRLEAVKYFVRSEKCTVKSKAVLLAAAQFQVCTGNQLFLGKIAASTVRIFLRFTERQMTTFLKMGTWFPYLNLAAFSLSAIVD